MRKLVFLLNIWALLCCLVLVACGNAQKTVVPDKNALNYDSFVKKIQNAGMPIVKADAMNSDFFSGKPYGLVIKGERISIFEYPTSEDAQNEAKRISSQGDTIQGHQGNVAAIDWVSTPHFYRAGRLLVLYIGVKPPVVSLLKSILGPQFAGDQ
jgi:hypothetical protein